MKIELTQTKDDLVSFYQFDRWYSEERKKYRIKTRLTWGAITTIPLWLIIINSDNGKVISPTGASVSLVPTLQNLFQITHPSPSCFMLGLSSFCFFLSAQARRLRLSRRGYETIKKVKSDTKYYYLYNTSFSAYVIPKSIFKTDEDAKEFESVLKNLRHN